MTDGLDAWAAEFAAPEGYLNFGSYGPPARRIADETSRLLALAVEGADSGRHLHAMDARAIAAVSRLSGFDEPSIGLVPSTSLGLFQAAFGMPSGEVLVSGDEFPSNLYPWWRAQEAGRLRVRPLDGAGTLAPVTPDRVRAALTRDTIAVSVSAVDFRTGFRADLAGLREAIGDRLLVVDAIQGFGVADLPWDAADVVVAGGQKWMRAGWGCGFIALSDRALDRLAPTLGGWTGVDQPSRYDGLEHPPADGARRLSITNGSPFASGALAAALELIEQAGVPAIEATIADRTDTLIERLTQNGVIVASPRDRGERAGIVVARFDDDTAPARHERLAAAGVTTTLHGTDRIRMSVHATTTEAAVISAADTLKGIS